MQYGNKVIIKYNEINKTDYEVSDKIKGAFTYPHDTFYYYNGEKFDYVDSKAKGKKGSVITTVTNNLYIGGIDVATNTKAYTLINEVGTYWVATRNTKDCMKSTKIMEIIINNNLQPQ